MDLKKTVFKLFLLLLSSVKLEKRIRHQGGFRLEKKLNIFFADFKRKKIQLFQKRFVDESF